MSSILLNKIKPSDTFAVPVAYSLNNVNWKMSELKMLDTKTKRVLTMHKSLALKNGGRGLIQLETNYKIAVIGLSTFLKTTNNLHLCGVSIMPKIFILFRKRHKKDAQFFQNCLNCLKKRTNWPQGMQREQSRKSDKLKNN